MREAFVTLRFLLGVIPDGLKGQELRDWVSERIEQMELGDLEDKAVEIDTEVK